MPAQSAHDLIVASRVKDSIVLGLDGQRIGHIEDLSIDKVTGQVRYALMSFGGFLGIGEKFHPLPWDVLDYDPKQAAYVVPLTAEALKQAPHYSKSELEAFGAGDQSYRDHLYAFYGPYGAARYW